jgi:RNA recognition motif-containing protein
MFSVYGEILSVFIKQTDITVVEKLPEVKRNHILNHQFAFITFKDPQSSMRLVDEFPYLKQTNKEFNDDLKKIVEAARKTKELDDRHLYRFSAYFVEEHESDWSSILSNKTQFTESLQAFKKYLSENDDNYIVKDKVDRIECCQALKKRERIKKLKILYEKIKKQIKEKYKFCNLYVKNLPDSFDDEQLNKLFSKYGRIRSLKICRKDLGHSMIGIKRSVKVYGYVCFFEASEAREAKNSLNNQSVFPNLPKLFVDSHQTRQERQEFLKLKMINQNQKAIQKGGFVESPFPKMMGHFGGGLRQFPVFAPQMLRKFPFNNPGFNPSQMGFPPSQFNPPPQQNNIDISQMDDNTKKEFFGDKLFSKISMNQSYAKFNDLHGKIVGIFIELEDNVLLRLLQDDNYFHTQVMATVRELREKNGKCITSLFII